MLRTLISRIRRNHGLEHATIHVLSETHRNFSAQGNSNHRGFYLNIYGDVSDANILAAVETAYRRMQAGESHLAVHPNCGTALLTTATMCTLAAQAAFGVEQRRQGRAGNVSSWAVFSNGLPSAILASALALIVSRPVGLYLQKEFTTDGNLGDLQLVGVRRRQPALVARFFQLLLGGAGAEAKSYFVETAG